MLMFARPIPSHCVTRQRVCPLLATALAALALSLLFSPVRAAAAPAASVERPKIGLALGGGGARGLAHIGVLRVLEELRVPVDFIAGTSSGAIVGGMYAAGLSPDEIESRIVRIDWDDILSDKVARRDLSYRRKQNDRYYLFPIEMGMRGFRPIFPRGLIAGQKVGFFLRTATLGAAGISDFDLLPIPFRAVATDLETGASVVLHKGDLTEALQASMAIPGIFSPVEIDGRLLVDGGMSANVPVEVVRAMGADIVIAVNISAPLLGRDEIDNIVDISDQTLSFLSKKTNQQQLALLRERDVLISPELSNVGTSEFERTMDIIVAGTTATRGRAPAMRSLTLAPKAYDAWRQRQRATIGAKHVDFINVRKPARVAPEIITRRLNTEIGAPLNVDTLRADLTRIYDLGDFESVSYRPVHSEQGEGLEIEAEEKSWGPNYLHFGLNLSDDFEGDSRFNILLNYTRTWMNTWGGEWKNEFSIGRTRKVFSEFYQPLDPFGVWFVAPHLLYAHDTRDVYEGDRRVAQYGTKVSELGFDTGLELGKHGELRLGIVRDWVDAAPRVGATTLPDYDVRQGAYVASFVYDRIDNVNFPRNGILASSRLFMARPELGSDNTYNKLDVNWLMAFTYNTHTMFAGADFGTRLNHELPFYDNFTLGGFQHLSGYRTAQLNGQYKAFGRLVYYERIGRLPKAAGDGIYIGGALEAGNVWNDRDDVSPNDLRQSIALFASAETMLGPLYFAYGLSDADNYAFYLFLGRTF